MIISVSSDNTVKQWIWNTDNVYIYKYIGFYKSIKISYYT